MINRTVAIETLGCKLNQAESELLAGELASAGYRLVDSSHPADIYIVNTCTVTHIADGKSRHLLREAIRRNPSAVVVATGCYAQRAPQDLARIEGLHLVVGHSDKSRLLSFLGVEDSSSLAVASGGLRTRTQVKVQDGCNNFCSYCIVPLVRGREQSLPFEEIVATIKARIAAGYREVVLTGTKIGSYRHYGTNLRSLLERILKDTKVERLRLSSLQPQELSPELVDLWADLRLCRHFHLALQSGCDEVLGRMGRCYTAADFCQTVGLLREKVPGAAITTDIIVGFPGESEQEFEESYHLCQEMDFARIHVFPYSPRSGTPAAQMAKQVASRVKREHARQMLQLARSSAQRFRKGFLRQTLPVLWEKQVATGVWSGLTDNYIRVFTISQEDLANRSLPTRLEMVTDKGMWGTVSTR